MRSDPWACGRPPATRGWGTGTGGAHRRQSLSQAPPAGSRDRAAFRVRVLRCAAGTYATQWRNMMAQTLLNQIVALEKGVKSRAYADFTAAHHQLQKTPLLSGISRTYKPKDDEGEQLPPESTRVQLRAAEVVKDVERALTRLFDVTLTKDVANGAAKAPIVVEGTTIATDVPVTYLLFLEKQLADLLTFVTKLPVLDAAETWSFDEATDAYATTSRPRRPRSTRRRWRCTSKTSSLATGRP